MAYGLIKDFDPSNSYEYVLKAVIYACVGQEEGSVSLSLNRLAYFDIVHLKGCKQEATVTFLLAFQI